MQTVRRWVDAINRNDVDAELSCWQPDGEHTIIASGTTIRGIEALRQGGERSAAAVSGQPTAGRKQITSLFATDELACVEYDSDATISGPITVKGIELVPRGVSRNIKMKACLVFHFRDGKFDRCREYFDTGSFARQLQISPTDVADVFSENGIFAQAKG
jgi:ketosteroid isomerase-like protein